MNVQVGDFFRQYKIIEKVGEGGMGVVYRAHDMTLGRDVALKFIVHGPSLAADLRERLQREARALAALNHPNILTIHDIGDADGAPFLVLEWMDGGALNDGAFRRQLPIPEFLHVAPPIAEATPASDVFSFGVLA